VRVACCFEAGYDGFWLHRWLCVRIPRDRGRGFHGIVGVKSTGRRAAIPRDRGHLGSGA
jgi:hypothetical protein